MESAKDVLQAKSETFGGFKEFKALIESRIDRQICILRSHNGGEYESNEFDDFCREARIKKALTVPYNPWQNGVVERKNRMICEAAKAMITDLDLPLFLWAEATGTPICIQNRSLHAILGEKTPEEVFTKKKPAVDHMRILALLCMSMCQKKRGPSQSPPVRKVYLLGTVIARRHIEYIYQDKRTLRSAEM